MKQACQNLKKKFDLIYSSFIGSKGRFLLSWSSSCGWCLLIFLHLSLLHLFHQHLLLHQLSLLPHLSLLISSWLPSSYMFSFPMMDIYVGSYVVLYFPTYVVFLMYWHMVMSLRVLCMTHGYVVWFLAMDVLLFFSC